MLNFCISIPQIYQVLSVSGGYSKSAVIWTEISMPGSSFGESGKCCHRVKQALMTLDKTADNSAEETKVDSLWILGAVSTCWQRRSLAKESEIILCLSSKQHVLRAQGLWTSP